MNADAVAFRCVASVLRAWPANPGLARRVLSRDLDWSKVLAAADRGLALPAVAAAVEDLGVADAVPDDYRALLAYVRGANRARNERLRASMAQAVRALNRAGIEPLLLKGANRLVDDLYPDLGWRLMGDLDLLVPPDSEQEAFRTLRAIGYEPVAERADDHQHLPDLVHAETGVMVELHRDMMPARLRSLVSTDEVCRAASRTSIDGALVQTPRLPDQLLHLIVHDQLSHDGLLAGRASLRALLEARLLVARLVPDQVAGVRQSLAKQGRDRATRVFFTLLAATVGEAPAGIDATALDRFLAARAIWHDRTPRAARLSIGTAEFLRRTARLRQPRHARRVAAGLVDPRFLRRRAAEVRATFALLNPIGRLPPNR
ncbi:nucleotidyltransferase family protein [Marinivivus vitaminiproducens]|uniref:nucleotidyltransferase family protein n=1 Tax=Marinivivus vitaminiproducens TaxID=3035935 RepID=UPI0027980601|nr:nucleotidyltransferase family protein [Geminicoccaceae bacterium SCSIO 64248]